MAATARDPRSDRGIATKREASGGATSTCLASDNQQAGREKPACAREDAMWALLLIPFIGLLWVPFYNFAEPSLFGFPFFYWYQFAWIPITSFLIWLVYRSRTPDETQEQSRK
jgi:hypothetical protein